MKRIVLVVFLFLPSIALSRGMANSFDVELVRVDSSGRGYVQFTSNLVANNGDLPECGSDYPRALAFDTNTPDGQSILSMVLSAKMSKSKVFAMGTNECSGYAVIENMSYGYVK